MIKTMAVTVIEANKAKDQDCQLVLRGLARWAQTADGKRHPRREEVLALVEKGTATILEKVRRKCASRARILVFGI